MHMSRAIVQDYIVWICEASGRTNQLTFNGTASHPYDPRCIYQSSHFAVVHQYQTEEEQLLHLVESSPKNQLQPCLQSQQYLKPGDKSRIDRPRMFNLNEKQEVETSDAMFKDPYRFMIWDGAPMVKNTGFVQPARSSIPVSNRHGCAWQRASNC